MSARNFANKDIYAAAGSDGRDFIEVGGCKY